MNKTVSAVELLGIGAMERLVRRICHKPSAGAVFVHESVYMVEDIWEAKREFIQFEFLGQYQGQTKKKCIKSCVECNCQLWQMFASDLDKAYDRYIDSAIGKFSSLEDECRELDYNYRKDFQGRVRVNGRVLPVPGAI